MTDISDFVNLLYDHGLTAALVTVSLMIFVFLVRTLMDEDKSALWRGRIYRAIYSVSGQREAEKKSREQRPPITRGVPCCAVVCLGMPSPLPRWTARASLVVGPARTRRPSPRPGRVGIHNSLSGRSQSSLALRPADSRPD